LYDSAGKKCYAAASICLQKGRRFVIIISAEEKTQFRFYSIQNGTFYFYSKDIRETKSYGGIYMVGKKLFTAKNIAYLAVLLALVIVLQTFGGTIKIGPCSLNFTLVPIVLGAILLGPVAGGILGLACGIVVLIQVIIGGDFYAVIWTGNPFVTTLTCLVKTTAAGIIAGVVYRLIAKKNKYVAIFTAAGLVPVINTAIFILGMLCMSNVLSDAYGLNGIDILIFILVSLITFNFFIEFAINMVIAPALARVVGVVEKAIGKKSAKHSA